MLVAHIYISSSFLLEQFEFCMSVYVFVFVFLFRFHLVFRFDCVQTFIKKNFFSFIHCICFVCLNSKFFFKSFVLFFSGDVFFYLNSDKISLYTPTIIFTYKCTNKSYVHTLFSNLFCFMYFDFYVRILIKSIVDDIFHIFKSSTYPHILHLLQ